MKPTREELIAMLKELSDFLDFCGWGDSYERFCAVRTGIPKRLEEMLEKCE